MPENEMISRATKREATNPLLPRVEILEDKTKELKESLEECQDVKARMQVLDERTQILIKQADENKAAIQGNNGSPGIKTRLSNLETKMDEVKQFMGETKKLGYAVLIAALGIFIELLVQLVLSHGTVLAK